MAKRKDETAVEEAVVEIKEEEIKEEVKEEHAITIPTPKKKVKAPKETFISRKLKVINTMNDQHKARKLAERVMKNGKEK